MTYTDRMEDLLFQWDLDEDCDDYSRLIESINNEVTFRTFGEGLLCFLQKHNPEITSDTAAKYIKNICVETEVPVKDIASSDNTLKGWFKTDNRPKKGDDSRRKIFALAFALQLNADETAELFHKVYLDRAFDYRSILDIVCYFCLTNYKTWHDVNRIIDSVKDTKVNNNDYTAYTAQIKSDVQIMTDEDNLIDYIKNHGHNLEKRNVSAKETVKTLISQANELAKKESELPEYRDCFAGCDRTSKNFTYEVITNLPVSGEKGTKTFFKNARLPKEIKSRFPEAGTLSKKEPTYEELRKLIILLASYKHWVGLKFSKTESDIEVYIDEINLYLNDSGFSPIYYGNPYDWLFLFCSLSDNPLDTFREIIAEVLEGD